MDEWHPSFGEFEIPFLVDSTGLITLNTGLGQAIMRLDPNNLEITGSLNNREPAVYLHLKKRPPLPKGLYTVEEIKVQSTDSVELYGHLHLPKANTSKTAIIIVGGRGCYAGVTNHNITCSRHTNTTPLSNSCI